MSDWATSGGRWLTGHPDQAPLDPVGDPLGAARDSLVRVERWARERGRRTHFDLDVLLFGRAGLAGFARRGRVSAGGACRLLPAGDGWLAVNLAREDDLSLLPAWLELPVDAGHPWPSVTEAVRERPAAELVERAVLLGLPVAALGEARGHPSVVLDHARNGRAGSPDDLGLVVDLSAMWAGPLCAHVLTALGARVVKVESVRRPDGLRGGDRRFYDWLHQDQRSVALDFEDPGDRGRLCRLLAAADIVIDASRPRALTRLGIDLDALVVSRAATLVSITGHGRCGAAANRVAFGDDAAVAGGLVAYDLEGDPVFCGDAIADPLTGLAAAAGALEALDGRGGRVDVSMAGVAAAAASRPPAAPSFDPAARPPVPPASPPAAPAGRDNAEVFAEIDDPVGT